MLVAFSLALASSAWEPPFGSLALFLVTLAGVWLFYNPPWLTYVARGVLFGTFGFLVVCVFVTAIGKELSDDVKRLVGSIVGYMAMRYTLAIGGIPGGVIGYIAHLRLVSKTGRGSLPFSERR